MQLCCIRPHAWRSMAGRGGMGEGNTAFLFWFTTKHSTCIIINNTSPSEPPCFGTLLSQPSSHHHHTSTTTTTATTTTMGKNCTF